MASASGSGTGEVWPEADWELWPGTRVGALFFNLVITIFFIIVPAVYWMRRRQQANDEHNANRAKSSTQLAVGLAPGSGWEPKRFVLPFRLWRCYPAGYDQVDIVSGNSTATGLPGYWLKASRHRTWDHMGCCLLCCQCSTQYIEDTKFLTTNNGGGTPLSDIDQVELSEDSSLRRCSIIVLTFFAACLFGMYLHFIPCIWWTCDWGPHDGEGVRGAIWFITWPIAFIIMLILLPQPALKVSKRSGNATIFYIVGSSRSELASLLDEILKLRAEQQEHAAPVAPLGQAAHDLSHVAVRFEDQSCADSSGGAKHLTV